MVFGDFHQSKEKIKMKTAFAIAALFAVAKAISLQLNLAEYREQEEVLSA